ncbi:hypothetical protein NL676_018977 [Syzygium grande]|nr:hypothetical protein NL676_018977 [Syzygium grande]
MRASLSLFDPSRHYSEFIQEETPGQIKRDVYFSSEASNIREAYYSFMFTYFSADVIVNFLEMQDGFSIICKKWGAAAFKPVETKLGFSYDVY